MMTIRKVLAITVVGLAIAVSACQPSRNPDDRFGQSGVTYPAQ